jgi:hypothetical protein
MDLRLAVLAFCSLSPGLASQDGITERMFCDPADPVNRCPGSSCFCSDDGLEVVFEESGESLLPLEGPVTDREIPVSVNMVARSSEIHAWSYGIAHDETALELRSATFEGTEHEALFKRLFHVLTSEDIVTCKHPAPAECIEEKEGGGFVSAIVLSLSEFVNLPRGRIQLSSATYRIPSGRALVAPTTIAFSEHLGKRGSPPVGIAITNGGRHTQPTIVHDGWLLVAPPPFHRGDPDGDGRSSIGDAVQVLLFLFAFGPTPACLDAADFDDDGRIDQMDPILILRWLFLHGLPPASPGPPGFECGRDPSPNLGCREYPGC